MGFRGEAVRLRAFVKAIGDCEMHLIEPAPVLRFLEGNGPLTTFWFPKYHTLKRSIATPWPATTAQAPLCHSACRRSRKASAKKEGSIVAP
jgi:hypothetical protein